MYFCNKKKCVDLFSIFFFCICLRAVKLDIHILDLDLKDVFTTCISTVQRGRPCSETITNRHFCQKIICIEFFSIYFNMFLMAMKVYIYILDFN